MHELHKPEYTVGSPWCKLQGSIPNDHSNEASGKLRANPSRRDVATGFTSRLPSCQLSLWSLSISDWPVSINTRIKLTSIRHIFPSSSPTVQQVLPLTKSMIAYARRRWWKNFYPGLPCDGPWQHARSASYSPVVEFRSVISTSWSRMRRRAVMGYMYIPSRNPQPRSHWFISFQTPFISKELEKKDQSACVAWSHPRIIQLVTWLLWSAEGPNGHWGARGIHSFSAFWKHFSMAEAVLDQCGSW